MQVLQIKQIKIGIFPFCGYKYLNYLEEKNVQSHCHGYSRRWQVLTLVVISLASSQIECNDLLLIQTKLITTHDLPDVFKEESELLQYLVDLLTIFYQKAQCFHLMTLAYNRHDNWQNEYHFLEAFGKSNSSEPLNVLIPVLSESSY